METGPIRVAIMADTHGVLRPEVERILETCDVIVHAGDFDNQMLYHKLNVDQPLYAVRGNNDRGWSGGLGQVNRFEIGGVKFIMAHVLFVVVIIYGMKYFGKQGNQLSAAMRLPMKYIYLCIPVGCGFMLVHAVDAVLGLLFGKEEA